jgi:ABC-2 type transport system ATP-binding protein
MSSVGADPIAEVRDLYRQFGDARAVSGVSFSVEQGEVLGFLGANGAGKTTTMQIIAGALAPSSGEVRISGHDLAEHPKACKAEIGYLPEHPPLYPELTVDEYLRYAARLRGLSRAILAGALEDAKARCGLSDVGHRLIGNLSKGYQQRVGIAQAIIHRPALVILDEPTVGLDPIQIREIRALIVELGGDHSVILSTHLLPEAQSLCDRVQILHEGRIVFSSSVAELDTTREDQSLRIALRRPPRADALQSLDGVRRVEDLGPGRFRLFHHTDTPLADTVFQAAAKQDWALYELVPEERSLEELFVELTFGEEAGGVAPESRESASP